MAPHSDTYGFVKTLLGDGTTTFAVYSHIALLFNLALAAHNAEFVKYKELLPTLDVVVRQVTVVASKIAAFLPVRSATVLGLSGKHTQVSVTGSSVF